MLTRFEEQEFLSRFSLPGKKQVPIGYSMYCPVPNCTEGTAKHRRRVAYILTGNVKNNYNTFSCRRCGTSHSFKKFLELYQPTLYEEYVERDRQLSLIRLKEGRRRHIEEMILEYPDLEFIELPEGMIPAVNDAGAYAYCKKRKIPDKVIHGLKFAKIIEVESDGEIYEYKDMLVFPFYIGEEIYGYQARSINGKTFYTESQEGYKVYNFYNIDRRSPCYIFESIIDSLYMSNSISMLGGDLPDHFLQKLEEPVFVFDNDVTTSTFKKMEKYAQKYKVVIWPEEIIEKDVNEMICNGYTSEEITNIIKRNNFSGVGAQVRLGILNARKKRR